MNWYLAALRKYATFSGRSQRSEYWYFILIYICIYVALVVAGRIAASSSPIAGIGLQLVGAIFSLGMFIPSLAVSVRRLHDTDRSGWWFLIALIPIVGGIVLLIFFVQDSQAGQNRFGPNPKGNADATGSIQSQSGGVSKAVIAVVVGLLAITVLGVLAGVAVPAYQDYTMRVKLTEALGELGGFRTQLAELAKRDVQTATLASSGISLNSRKNFRSLYYDPKTATLIGNLVEPFQGRSIGIQYRRSAGDAAELICGSKNLELKHLPTACQHKIDYLDEAEALAYQRPAEARVPQPATGAQAPPAAAQTQAAPAVLQPVAPSSPPPRMAELPQPVPAAAGPAVANTAELGADARAKPAAVAPVARHTAEFDAEARARARDQLEARRRAETEHELEVRRRLKAQQTECVYKPVMTDEDRAKCGIGSPSNTRP